MTTQLNHRLLQLGLLLVFGIYMLLVTGCGVDNTPVASTDEAPDIEQGIEVVVLHAEYAEGYAAPAAKKTKAQRKVDRAARQAEREAKREERQRQRDLELRFDSERIGPDGGKLQVGTRAGKGGQDDIKAQLHVPELALNEPTELTMELQGNTLSTITLVFGPSLVFEQPARLNVFLGRDAVDLDLDTVVALHVTGDGDGDGAPDLIEEVPIRMARGIKGLEVQILVPGFSRYSLSNGGH